jgi:hypothetical protein
MKYNLNGEIFDVTLERCNYRNNNGLALELVETKTGEPFMMCTVNIPNLSDGEVAIKNYSENEGVLDFLIKEGIIEPPHRFDSSGYVSLPVCKVK